MTRDAVWLQTVSGKQFLPLAPTPEMICVEDIAHGLSHLCRFSGQVRQFYSVADHSIHVSEIVDDEKLKLAALLHDASESFIVDLPAPIKRHVAGYLEIETKIMMAVAARFGIDYELFAHLQIKEADMIALATEKRDLMGPEPAPWIDLPRPSMRPLAIRTSQEAKRAFLFKFEELGGKR